MISPFREHSVSGGAISNGKFYVKNAGATTFGAATISAWTNVSTNTILLNGATFGDSLFIVKKNHTSNDVSIGGNTFNGYVSIIDSATSGKIYLADSLPDTFNSTLYLSGRGGSNSQIYLAHRSTGNTFNGDVIFDKGPLFSNYYGTATFNSKVSVSGTGSGAVSFGVSTGSCIFDSTFVIGTSGFTAGSLLIRNATFADSTLTTNLTLTSTANTIIDINNTFKGPLVISSPSISFRSSKFLNTVSITKTGASASTSLGGNYFAKAATFTNTGNGASNIANTSRDTFLLKAIFHQNNNTSTSTFSINHGLFQDSVLFSNGSTYASGDRFLVANTGTCTFKGNVTITNTSSSMSFGISGGSSTLQTTGSINFTSGAGTLTLKNFTKSSTNAMTISQGTLSKLTLGPGSSLTGLFSYNGPNIALNGCTFADSVNILRYGTTGDISIGGNVFNGSTVIMDSSSTGHNFILANAQADDFNHNAKFIQKGTGVNLYPAYGANSNFAGNIIIDGTSPIIFGNNGGKVILDGITSTISSLSSQEPVFKKIQINKAGGSLTLNTPVTISDSLILTKGVVNSDTVNLLTISHGGKSSLGSDTSYVNGPMKKIGNSAFVFPLGKGDTYPYHPLEITAPSTSSDAYTAEHFKQQQTLGTAIDTSIDNLNACHYWKLQRVAGTSKVKVKLSWNNDSCETIAPVNYRAAGWDGTKWKDLGNSAYSGDSIKGTVTSVDSVSTISYLTLAFKKCSAFRTKNEIIGITCNGRQDGSASIFPAGGTEPYSFEWPDRLGVSNSAIDLSAMLYLVTVSDARGCVLMDSIYIDTPDSIQISFISTSSSCSNKTGSLLATIQGGIPPYKYYWSELNVHNTLLDSIASGVYRFIVEDSAGCFVSKEGVVADSTGPNISIDSVQHIQCYGFQNGSSFARVNDGAGPFTFQWIPSDEHEQKAFKLQKGLNQVMVTDSIGCKSIRTIEITEPDLLQLDLSTVSSTCGVNNGEASVSVIGGTTPYTYKWSSGETKDEDVNEPAGLDSVLVIDGKGCIATGYAIINDNSNITISVSTLNEISCMNGTDGRAVALATGGISPYNYQWESISINNDTAENLGTGKYIVSVIDGNNCRKRVEYEIFDPPGLGGTFEVNPPETTSSFDGSITVMPAGGTPPYSYLWFPSGQSTSQIKNLGPGIDSVLVMDSKNCMRWFVIDHPDNNCGDCNELFNYCNFVVPPPNCAPNCSPVTKNLVTDFLADGTDNTTDQCAFEEAINYFRQHLNTSTSGGFGQVSSPTPGWGTLFIPSGTYYVGVQQWTNKWYKDAHNVMCLKDFENFNIVGGPLDANGNPTTFIKYSDCMWYGSFDPTQNADRWIGAEETSTGCAPLTLPACTLNSGSNVVTIPAGTTTNNICIGMQVTGNGIAPNSSVTSIGTSSFTLNFNSTVGSATISNLTFTDPNYNVCPEHLCHPNYYDHVGEGGSCILLKDCKNISIQNLDLNGNSDGMTVGGAFCDGIQVEHNGINIERSKNVTIENVRSHHFGLDGLYLSNVPCNNSPKINHMNIVLENCTFENNARNGMSWGSGAGLFAKDCLFKKNGIARFRSSPSSGLDIEWENAGATITRGTFANCMFMQNLGPGFISDAYRVNSIGIQTGWDNKAFGFEFLNCEFIGSENDGYNAWPHTRRIKFENCNFHGLITRAFPYNDCQTCDKDYETEFLNCDFFETYDDTSYTFVPEDEWLCTNCAGTNCRTSHHHLMDFSAPQASRVSFDGCSWNTRLSLKWARLAGGPLINGSDHNFIRMEGANNIFRTTGLSQRCGGNPCTVEANEMNLYCNVRFDQPTISIRQPIFGWGGCPYQSTWTIAGYNCSNTWPGWNDPFNPVQFVPTIQNLSLDMNGRPKYYHNHPASPVGSSRVDLQACKLEYSIVSPK